MRVGTLAVGTLLRVLWVIPLQWDSVKADIVENAFVKASEACNSHVAQNALEDRPARSMLECTTRCFRDETCESVLYCKRAEKRQCLLSSVQANVSCPTNSSSCTNLEKFCRHGGFQRLDDTCRCVRGYVGSRCEHLTTDCKALKGRGVYTLPGVFLIKPSTSPTPFYVKCNALGGTIMMMRSTGLENFNRSWSEYAEGFGDLLSGSAKEYWTGLRYWHYLTQSGRFDVSVYIIKANDLWVTHRYENVKVQDMARSWTMIMSSSRGNLGSTALRSGNAFSTFDQDNDGDSGVNCAETHGGGWWYSDCGGSNPTGPLLRAGGDVPTGNPPEAYWTKKQGGRLYPKGVRLTLWKL